MRRLAAAALSVVVAGCGGGPSPLPVFQADSSALKATVFAAHASEPIPAGKGVLWCATFQLAWDGLCDGTVRGPLLLGPPAPQPLVGALNRREFPRSALDPASFVAGGGWLKEGVLDRLRKELREKFGAGAPDPGQPPLPPLTEALGYAYLLKRLPFETPFNVLPRPLEFRGGTKPVSSFGIHGDASEDAKDRMRRQVTILSYETDREKDDGYPHEFVFEIRPKGGRDRLLFACLPPGPTLEATWKDARGRVLRGRPEPVPEEAALVVPRMGFDLEHAYRQFDGAALLNPGVDRLMILEARQRIRFELSEAGAVLESEARAPAAGAARLGEIPHLVLDRPFLLALVEKDAKEPYFLYWVGNDELLAEAK